MKGLEKIKNKGKMYKENLERDARFSKIISDDRCWFKFGKNVKQFFVLLRFKLDDSLEVYVFFMMFVKF